MDVFSEESADRRAADDEPRLSDVRRGGHRRASSARGAAHSRDRRRASEGRRGPGPAGERDSRQSAPLQAAADSLRRPGFEIDPDAIAAQEAVADDAAELDAEQDARRPQVQHDRREVVEADAIEGEVEPRIAGTRRDPIPSSRTPSAGSGAIRLGPIAVAIAVLIEITSPPVSTTKLAGSRSLTVPRTIASR